MASIKPSAPPEMGRMFVGTRGGPGTSDPTRFTCTNCAIPQLILIAYNIRPYQLNAPGDLNSQRFDIVAKIPEKSTKEDFRVMMQKLLAERFKLVIHRDTKEMPLFDLVIGKSGPKFKESPDQSDTVQDATGPIGPPKIGKDGFPEMAPGRSGMLMMNGRARITAYKQTMEQLAGQLGNQAGRPVMNATGLTKKYDFTLTFAPENVGGPGPFGGGPPPGGGSVAVAVAGPGGERPPTDDTPLPTLAGALQEQLGLKLEGKKGPVEIIVVDKVEKTPTEN